MIPFGHNMPGNSALTVTWNGGMMLPSNSEGSMPEDLSSPSLLEITSVADCLLISSTDIT